LNTPHICFDAPRVERRAGAGAQAQPGQAQPPLLVIGRALAGLGDLDDRVEQPARGGGGPLVTPRREHVLEVAHQRRQQRRIAAERGHGAIAGLAQPRVRRRLALVVVGRASRAAGAHVEGQPPAIRRRAALDAPHLDRAQLGDRDLEPHVDARSPRRAQHRDDRRQLEQVAAVVERVGAAVADRHQRARRVGAGARREQLEPHRPVGHQREVAVELDPAALVEPLGRQAHRHRRAGAVDAEVERARGAAADARRQAAAHQPEVRGAQRHRELRRVAGELAGPGAVGVPGRELIEHAIAQGRRRHRAAVEQHGVDARAAVARQERRQVPGDRRVAGVGQPELLQAAAAALRRRAGRHLREEAVDQHRAQLGRGDAIAQRAGDQPRAAGRDGDRHLVRRRVAEQRLLGQATGVDQPVPLQRVEPLAAAGGEPLFDQLGQRQIDVVAAEQQVIADRDAREPAVGVDADQREVGGAAADVEHQHAIAGRQRPRDAAVGVDPRVERRLRLLEQHHRGQAGLLRGQRRQLAGRLVERRRAGDDDVLLDEARARPERVVPGVADMAEDRRLGRDRRQPRPVLAAPRQDRGLAVDAGVAQPRLGRGDHPLRVARPLGARQLADDGPVGGGRRPPRQRHLAGAEVVLAGQVDERRQLPPRAALARGDELRDLEHAHAGIGRGRVDVGHRGVGRPEIDADQVTGRHPRGFTRRRPAAPATARGKLPGCAAAWAR
jgi:hypothetical protein